MPKETKQTLKAANTRLEAENYKLGEDAAYYKSHADALEKRIDEDKVVHAAHILALDAEVVDLQIAVSKDLPDLKIRLRQSEDTLKMLERDADTIQVSAGTTRPQPPADRPSRGEIAMHMLAGLFAIYSNHPLPVVGVVVGEAMLYTDALIAELDKEAQVSQ